VELSRDVVVPLHCTRIDPRTRRLLEFLLRQIGGQPPNYDLEFHILIRSGSLTGTKGGLNCDSGTLR
jgi:hypothetical protein